MSLKKNISGGELDVPLLGRSVGDGEIVEVPDFQPAHSEENPLSIVWPPDKWEPVDGSAPGALSMTPGSPGALYGNAGDGTSTEGM